MESQQNMGILLSVIGVILVVSSGVFDFNDAVRLIVVLIGAALAVGGAVAVWRARRG